MRSFSLFKRRGGPPRTEKQIIGKRGEELAVDFLVKNGFVILERNWRHKRQEIDIIAEKNTCVSFIEVKTTASDRAESFKRPSEAVDRRKRENITDCARAFALHRRRTIFDLVEDYRFDVIEIFLNRDEPEINFYENAFYKEKGKKRNGKSYV